ncbi:hypothetical protein CEXT_123751 [Caerostris extrusa]|uniref:Secreted protein n=1 Tax=Caerostris extrusa TaxID=172846 RepID=A0AAV4TIB5_CAEEX|nr:hypothetical protein CEXT_123751 [Caerostris extrusa]
MGIVDDFTLACITLSVFFPRFPVCECFPCSLSLFIDFGSLASLVEECISRFLASRDYSVRTQGADQTARTNGKRGCHLGTHIALSKLIFFAK